MSPEQERLGNLNAALCQEYPELTGRLNEILLAAFEFGVACATRSLNEKLSWFELAMERGEPILNVHPAPTSKN